MACASFERRDLVHQITSTVGLSSFRRRICRYLFREWQAVIAPIKGGN
jgi:hypothetical protein